MKLFKGKKRLAMRMMSARHRDLMQWALSVKPGDYIATCEGCNRKVKEISFVEWANEGQFRRSKPNKTWFVREVDFTDTHGWNHSCPGGGCALPPETNDQIVAYWKDRYLSPDLDEHTRKWSNPKDVEDLLAHNKKFRDALSAGIPIIDEHGELLPEFDHH